MSLSDFFAPRQTRRPLCSSRSAPSSPTPGHPTSLPPPKKRKNPFCSAQYVVASFSQVGVSGINISLGQPMYAPLAYLLSTSQSEQVAQPESRGSNNTSDMNNSTFKYSTIGIRPSNHPKHPPLMSTANSPTEVDAASTLVTPAVVPAIAPVLPKTPEASALLRHLQAIARQTALAQGKSLPHPSRYTG